MIGSSALQICHLTTRLQPFKRHTKYRPDNQIERFVYATEGDMDMSIKVGSPNSANVQNAEPVQGSQQAQGAGNVQEAQETEQSGGILGMARDAFVKSAPMS